MYSREHLVIDYLEEPSLQCAIWQSLVNNLAWVNSFVEQSMGCICCFFYHSEEKKTWFGHNLEMFSLLPWFLPLVIFISTLVYSMQYLSEMAKVFGYCCGTYYLLTCLWTWALGNSDGFWYKNMALVSKKERKCFEVFDEDFNLPSHCSRVLNIAMMNTHQNLPKNVYSSEWYTLFLTSESPRNVPNFLGFEF